MSAATKSCRLTSKHFTLGLLLFVCFLDILTASDPSLLPNDLVGIRSGFMCIYIPRTPLHRVHGPDDPRRTEAPTTDARSLDLFCRLSRSLVVERLPPLAIQLNNTTLVNRLQTAEGCQHSYFLCIFFSKLITTTIHLCHF